MSRAHAPGAQSCEVSERFTRRAAFAVYLRKEGSFGLLSLCKGEM
jgi:hypothetical protein